MLRAKESFMINGTMMSRKKIYKELEVGLLS
jgi:hypothetical protein